MELLQMLIGPSGSGKTHRILAELADLAEAEQENLLWLVPEQHSFACERALLKRLGPQKAARVQVLSFSRLADMVFRQTGGLAGENLDEATRTLLMSRALEQVSAAVADSGDPMAGLRSRLSTDCAYVEQLLRLWEELRQCAVSTTELERVAADLSAEEGEDSLLTVKTTDLYRVFTAYEGYAAATGADELDRLTRLARQLPDSTLCRDATVFVDGFKGFTAQELAVLDVFVPRCRRLTVALGTDTPGMRWPGEDRRTCRREFPLFSPVTKTVERLQELAERHGMAWELTTLETNHRTTDPALQALEAGLYAPSPAVWEQEAEAVTVTPCADVYEESRYVARCIRRLMREGYRLRDITVVMRNPADYQGILDEMLSRQGVPCFMDQRRDILSEPLVVYLRAALRLAVGGWKTEELLRLLKTDLWPLSPVEIAELENYVYMWRIEGNQWEQEWTENPSGLGVTLSEKDRAMLERLNGYRSALMESLSVLKRRLRGSVTGRRFAGAVYDWLADQAELPNRIACQSAVLEEMAQPVLSAHAARLWDEVIRLLDRFVLALGDQSLAATRMEELFTLLCRTIDMGVIPQGLDAVTIGGVDRIRYDSPHVVFVMGANEGVLPAYPISGGLLTEEERRTLKRRGLALAEDVLTQCVEERYYVYMAVAAPSQRLYVTYTTATESAPSPLVTAIRTILPHHRRGCAVAADGTDLESADEMFQRMAQDYAHPTGVTATLKQVVAEQPAYGERLAAVERSAEGMAVRLTDPATPLALYGSDMVLSASQTDEFYRCKFKYFCHYGLRLHPRKMAQLDRGVFGTLVHYVMETLVPRYMAPDGLVAQLRQQIPDDKPDPKLLARLQADVEQVTEAYINRQMGGTEGKDGRFLYQVGLARRSACNMLWHTLMELQQGQFDPVDFELDIHPEESDVAGVVSIRLPHKQGSLQIRGKVDRVDVFHRFDGTSFVRVVDYKTGKTTFSLGDVAEGLGMQMLVYLFVVCDNSRRYLEQEGVLRPAGVLYHKLSDLVVQRGADHTARLQKMCMEGVVLDDASVLLAMEPKGEKCYIPAKLDAKGLPTGEVVSLHQFSLLRRTVEQMLVSMADTLLEGDIAALPLKKGDHSTCTYCDYRVICGRDPEDPVREFAPKSRKAYLEELELESEEVNADE